MPATWQQHWTFRIVDQDSGASVAGVPVTVLEDGGSPGHRYCLGSRGPSDVSSS